MAGKILTGNSGTMGHSEYLANSPCLMSSYLPCLIKIRLRQHSKTSFLNQVSLSRSLEQKRSRIKVFSEYCLLINNLKLISQKTASGGRNFGYLHKEI